MDNDRSVNTYLDERHIKIYNYNTLILEYLPRNSYNEIYYYNSDYCYNYQPIFSITKYNKKTKIKMHVICPYINKLILNSSNIDFDTIMFVNQDEPKTLIINGCYKNKNGYFSGITLEIDNIIKVFHIQNTSIDNSLTKMLKNNNKINDIAVINIKRQLFDDEIDMISRNNNLRRITIKDIIFPSLKLPLMLSFIEVHRNSLTDIQHINKLDWMNVKELVFIDCKLDDLEFLIGINLIILTLKRTTVKILPEWLRVENSIMLDKNFIDESNIDIIKPHNKIIYIEN